MKRQFLTVFLFAIFAHICGANALAQNEPVIKTINPSELTQKYEVDFTKQLDPIRPINGINLWAKLSCETLEDYGPYAEACHFSTVRLHDAPWDNNGIRLVDVQQIFGNLDADPNDPKNYYFEPTDDYIAKIKNAGCETIYRLGTSIEHTARKYFAIEPKDPEHYAEICAAIVRHYNAKWANGFEWNIKYWEIWNEPDLKPQMWSGDFDSYCRFYVIVAKRLRQEFPNIKIGGPALTHANYGMIAKLANLCKKEGAPLDFVSWHCYARNPNELLDPPAMMRKTLDECGFNQCELHLNEWHYFPTDWNVIHGVRGGYQAKRELAESPEGLHGAEAAAFVALVLTRWLDTPLTISNYYAFALERWGLIDPYGKRHPVYYAHRFFGEQRVEAPIRVAAIDPGNDVSLLGSVDKSGSIKRLLVAAYKQKAEQTIEIALKGVPEQGEVQVDRVDYDNDFISEKVRYENGTLRLKAQKSSTFLVRF